MSDQKPLLREDVPDALPCPFCGKDEQMWQWDSPRHGRIAHVMCTACGAIGPRARTDIEAVRKWNTDKDGKMRE
jgi:Lar family restriction alleviation protein